MALILLLSMSICALSKVSSQNVGCYTPNGTERNLFFGLQQGSVYMPCNASATHSMCCALGGYRSTYPDVCMIENGVYNGLCQQSWDANMIYRESCTDPTWQDPACKKLFVNGTGLEGTGPIVLTDNGNVTDDVTLTPCDDGSWCSGVSNRECCVQGNGVFLNATGDQVSADPNAITTSSQSSTSSPTSSPTASTDSSATSSSTGLSTGAKAGIGVGVSIGALVVLGVIGFVLVKRRRSENRKSTHPPSVVADLHGPQNSTPVEYKTPIPSQETRAEMEGSLDHRSARNMRPGQPPAELV